MCEKDWVISEIDLYQINKTVFEKYAVHYFKSTYFEIDVIKSRKNYQIKKTLTRDNIFLLFVIETIKAMGFIKRNIGQTP